jgi:hypothetical protein
MHSHFSLRRRFARFLAPDDAIQGSASGGHAPDAMLPANKDTTDLPGGGGHSSSGGHSMPSQADIAQLAQQYWEEEGRPENQHNEHWFRAERTLRQQAGLDS